MLCATIRNRVLHRQLNTKSNKNKHLIYQRDQLLWLRIYESNDMKSLQFHTAMYLLKSVKHNNNGVISQSFPNSPFWECLLLTWGMPSRCWCWLLHLSRRSESRVLLRSEDRHKYSQHSLCLQAWTNMYGAIRGRLHKFLIIIII